MQYNMLKRKCHHKTLINICCGRTMSQAYARFHAEHSAFAVSANQDWATVGEFEEREATAKTYITHWRKTYMGNCVAVQAQYSTNKCLNHARFLVGMQFNGGKFKQKIQRAGTNNIVAAPRRQNLRAASHNHNKGKGGRKHMRRGR